MADVVVIFQLVGDFRHACVRHRAQVVIPPVDAFPRFAVIGGPAEVGGVDISRQAFFEPVHLVGAYEMHLARKDGLIAGTAQVVGVSRDVGGEFGGIVVDAGATRQLARHEGGTSGGAKRRGGIGVGEAHRMICKAAQVGGVQESGGAIREQGSGQLVHHKDQDVGLCGHGGPLRCFAMGAGNVGGVQGGVAGCCRNRGRKRRFWAWILDRRPV